MLDKRIRTQKEENIKSVNVASNNYIHCYIYRVVNETVYVGLSYYGPSMGSDAYLSFFLSAVVEIPGYVLCLLLMDRWGRRLLLCVCMVISGFAAISTALAPAGTLLIVKRDFALSFNVLFSSSIYLDAQVTTLILFLIAKMTIAGGTMIIFQFAGELYPTEVRGVGIGVASFLGGIALAAIPFINYLVINKANLLL